MTVGVGPVVAAVLLPPFGVFLRRGVGRDFWVACALTLVGFVPGLIFAVWSVLREPGDGTPIAV
ncbi:YqaE/Pmp3 family membrane protein [Roseomonas aeriglobus]|nr:YqaE/Pmp3 family membrane protein [Roseomonas aeriglobus]